LVSVWVLVRVNVKVRGICFFSRGSALLSEIRAVETPAAERQPKHRVSHLPSVSVCQLLYIPLSLETVPVSSLIYGYAGVKIFIKQGLLGQLTASFLVRMSEKSKKTYGNFSDYGSIYLVDMVLIRTYNVLISFKSSL
jgi:hypothetical protein